MEGSLLLDKALDGSFIGYHLNGTVISEVFLHDYQKLCKQSTNGNDFMWEQLLFSKSNFMSQLQMSSGHH